MLRGSTAKRRKRPKARFWRNKPFTKKNGTAASNRRRLNFLPATKPKRHGYAPCRFLLFKPPVTHSHNAPIHTTAATLPASVYQKPYLSYGFLTFFQKYSKPLSNWLNISIFILFTAAANKNNSLNNIDKHFKNVYPTHHPNVSHLFKINSNAAAGRYPSACARPASAPA